GVHQPRFLLGHVVLEARRALHRAGPQHRADATSGLARELRGVVLDVAGPEQRAIAARGDRRAVADPGLVLAVRARLDRLVAVARAVGDGRDPLDAPGPDADEQRRVTRAAVVDALRLLELGQGDQHAADAALRELLEQGPVHVTQTGRVEARAGRRRVEPEVHALRGRIR